MFKKLFKNKRQVPVVNRKDELLREQIAESLKRNEEFYTDPGASELMEDAGLILVEGEPCAIETSLNQRMIDQIMHEWTSVYTFDDFVETLNTNGYPERGRLVPVDEEIINELRFLQKLLVITPDIVTTQSTNGWSTAADSSSFRKQVI